MIKLGYRYARRSLVGPPVSILVEDPTFIVQYPVGRRVTAPPQALSHGYGLTLFEDHYHLLGFQVSSLAPEDVIVVLDVIYDTEDIIPLPPARATSPSRLTNFYRWLKKNNPLPVVGYPSFAWSPHWPPGTIMVKRLFVKKSYILC